MGMNKVISPWVRGESFTPEQTNNMNKNHVTFAKLGERTQLNGNGAHQTKLNVQ